MRNPEVRWTDPGDDHRFIVLDVTPARVQAAWFLLAGFVEPKARRVPDPDGSYALTARKG